MQTYAFFSPRFFSFKEKCPTLTVTFSFLQTTDLTLIGPLFREPPETIKAKSGQCKLSAKGPSFGFFSALCDFFPKFFQYLKRVPLQIF